MLKLPKGLKKKKKGKKSKKDQELFNEEELEQYRRDHQKQEQQSEQHPPVENDDEWSKFNALTAGVDNILKQKQEDLDRIKQTSFFKRVATPSEQKQLVELQKKIQQTEQERTNQDKASGVNKDKSEEERILAEAVVELSESESEEEDADDVFDTAYIDIIHASDVGLVDVDSPVDENQGPDPFDTSYAEKIIKGPEVSKRGKKLVSIGSAVEVLSGRVESVSSCITTRRSRRGPKELLLETVDDNFEIVSIVPEPVKTLLDDPFDLISDVPIDLSVSLHLQLQKDLKKTSEEHNWLEAEVIDEFDIIKKNSKEDNNDDEFEELAVESLTEKKEATIVTNTDVHKVTAEGDWAFFEQNKDEKPLSNSAFASTSDNEDLSFQEESSDPFDTAFVEKILPATLAEDADFDPRAENDLIKADSTINRNLFSPELSAKSEISNLLQKLEQTDLLRDTDFTQQKHCIQTQTIKNKLKKSNQNNLNDDPFDTSSINISAAPRSLELNVLEDKLSTSKTLNHSISDPDFDPRAEDEQQEDCKQIELTNHRKSSLVLNIASSTPSRLVKFVIPSSDLLKANEDYGNKIGQKPLTPYYPAKDPATATEHTPDPFDTSFATDIKPSYVELGLIEREILASDIKNSLSDQDFNPRAETPKPLIKNQTDLLSAENDFASKVLTPATESNKFLIEKTNTIEDPFDTSSVGSTLLLGKFELKVLAKEFVPESNEPTETDLFGDSQESIFAGKVLTPLPSNIFSLDFETELELDPFDTSFAENIAPGQTEIRVIETELINNSK